MAADRDAAIDRREALRRGMLLLAAAATTPAIAALAACTTAAPRPIVYGRDECAYCRMVVSDSRIAAALVSSAGRTVVFDSVECLASYDVQHRDDRGRDAVRSLWVSDYALPGKLIPAARARFIRLAGPSSPMGEGFAAFSSDADAHRLGGDGATSGWRDVVALVGREGLRRGAASSARGVAAGEADASRE